MKDIESNSMDLVVHTFILCSVDSPHAVISEIHRVLKPGGICLFIEHSLDKENKFVKFFQKLIGPLWYTCFDCKFKDMRLIFQDCKYELTSIKNYALKSKLLLLVNPVVYGYGVKKIN